MEIFKGASGLAYMAAVLAAALVIEAVVPWRRGIRIEIARWLRNASMAFYGAVILSLVPAFAGYGAAVAAEARGAGLFNAGAFPLWAQLIASFVVFDLMAYGEHRALHKWYFLWRAHRTHHADRHVDATTSLRFHPFETVFRAMVELPIVYLLGLPPEGVLFAFAIHVFINTATHANIALPAGLERVLSQVFITPRMHRLHHSTAPGHQYANFATTFSLWDRLFGSYCAVDNLHEDEIFGIEGPERIAEDTFANLALDPFRRPKDAAIPRPRRSDASVRGIGNRE